MQLLVLLWWFLKWFLVVWQWQSTHPSDSLALSDQIKDIIWFIGPITFIKHFWKKNRQTTLKESLYPILFSIYTIFFIKVKSISSDDFFDIPAGQNELFCQSKVKILCKLKTKVIKLKNGLTWNSWNCPFTNLRTNDDFPTADSPNSTNLNCANLPPAPAPALFEAPPGRAACEFAILNL